MRILVKGHGLIVKEEGVEVLHEEDLDGAPVLIQVHHNLHHGEDFPPDWGETGGTVLHDVVTVKEVLAIQAEIL